MGTVHDLLDMKGKAGTLQTGIDRTVVEAASLYMSDEDGSLGFAFSGWAQCALPHRRLAPDARWEIAGERVRLVVEPGLHPSSHDGPMEHIGVPYLSGRGADCSAPPPQIPACGLPAPGSCRRSNTVQRQGSEALTLEPAGSPLQ